MKIPDSGPDPGFSIQKTPEWRKFFAGIANGWKEGKISSLTLIFLRCSALVYAPGLPDRTLDEALTASTLAIPILL